MNVNEITINSLDDINKLTNTTNYEERPLILTKRTNPFIKFFIGVVIKYDKNFNILIRYLDNPLTGDKFWWFGGLKPGIDPLLYSILDYKDLLTIEDLIPDGYDDIINLKKEKIYQIENSFPYYGGKYGNIYTESYFKDLYEHNKKYLIDDHSLPNDIEKEFSLPIFRKRLLNLSDIQNNLNHHDENVLKKYISYQLNNAMKNKIYFEEKVELDILENIRLYFKNKDFKFQKNLYDIYTYLKVFCHIFNTRYVIYSYVDYASTLKVIGPTQPNTIYLYKINKTLYRIYECKDADSAETIPR